MLQLQAVAEKKPPKHSRGLLLSHYKEINWRWTLFELFECCLWVRTLSRSYRVLSTALMSMSVTVVFHKNTIVFARGRSKLLYWAYLNHQGISNTVSNIIILKIHLYFASIYVMRLWIYSSYVHIHVNTFLKFKLRSFIVVRWSKTHRVMNQW